MSIQRLQLLNVGVCLCSHFSLYVIPKEEVEPLMLIRVTRSARTTADVRSTEELKKGKYPEVELGFAIF